MEFEDTVSRSDKDREHAFAALLSRRRFLRGIGALGLLGMSGPALAACGALAPQSPTPGPGASGSQGPDETAGIGPIHLVSLFSLSGPSAETGQLCNEGVRLAAKEAESRHGLVVDIEELDDTGSVDEAVRRCRDALGQGSRFFTGSTLSNIALALSETINREGGVYTTGTGADAITGEECRTATFRWAVTTYGDVRESVGPLLKLKPELKRWYTITTDYVFGEGLLTATKDLLAEAGATHVGNSYHSLDETQFSSYLNNARAANPDVLLLLNFGGQSTTSLKQAISFGLRDELTLAMAVSSGLEQLRALGPEVLEGVYMGGAYWHTVDTSRNKEFVDAFRGEYGRTPGTLAAQGYEGARMILEGVARAGSQDPEAVIEALEGYTYDALTGPSEIRADDHQLLKDYLLLRGKARAEMADEDDLVEVLSSGQSYKSPSEAGCDALVPLGE
ncbi:MAG: branched-chain amino acid ABC transporter substrate-binding protein [Chloroflexi bacterium]|nr:branched-chain amino acid ABC transporter substrate-binding protein [Chloroflexota bacterium]